MNDEYIPIEELNKKRMNRLNPFQDLNEGKQFAKNVMFGTGRAIKKTGQIAYGLGKETFERIKSAKQRSGLGIQKLGKGENFGFGTKGFGVKFNTANPIQYKPPKKKRLF